MDLNKSIIQKKICGYCKLELPKTKDYFFVRIIKQQNKNGLATYYSFRSL